MKAAERDAEATALNYPHPTEPAAPSAQTDILRRFFPKENTPPAGVDTPEMTGSPHQTYVVKLVHNYRSHRKLLELPSRMFYKDELVATAEVGSSPVLRRTLPQ